MKNHSSTKLTKGKIIHYDEFNFEPIYKNNIFKEIVDIDISKHGTFGNIQRLKKVDDICEPILTNIWNVEIVKNKTFSGTFELVDITPIFQKKARR